MYSLQFYNKTGSTTRSIELDSELFSDDNINSSLIHEYVVMYLANQRQSTAHTKVRSEVSFSGKKLGKQKGAGRGRPGNAGSPTRRKGGVVFGPRNAENYELKMLKKMKKKAMLSSLIMQIKAGNVLGLESFDLSSIKTKETATILNNIQLANTKVLVVLPTYDETVIRSIRNIGKIRWVLSSLTNPYDILTHKKVLFIGDSLDMVIDRIAVS